MYEESSKFLLDNYILTIFKHLKIKYIKIKADVIF